MKREAEARTLGRRISRAVHAHARVDLDPARRDRIAAAVFDTLACDARGPRQHRLTWRLGLWLAAPALAVAAAVVMRPGSHAERPLQHRVTAGLVDPAGEVYAGAQGEALTEFSDGTKLALLPQGHARIEATGPHGASVRVVRGTLRAHVASRPGASWSFLAGPFRVHVTGTAFELSWSEPARRFDLSMSEGSVLVTGPGLTQPRALAAGEAMHVDLAVPPEPPEAARGPASPEPREPRAARARGLDGERRLARGDYEALLADARRMGLGRVLATASSGDLGALADAARFTGRDDLARRALSARWRRFSRNGSGADAAFLLGRLEDDRAHAPAGALLWYQRYLALAPDGPHAGEALGRTLVALSRLGRLAEAGRVARRYRERYPSGPYREVAEKLLR